MSEPKRSCENCGTGSIPHCITSSPCLPSMRHWTPAPAQAREDEAQLRGLLRSIRQTYSDGVWAWTEDQCLAALRSRQSPQAVDEVAGLRLDLGLLKISLEHKTRLLESADARIAELESAAPQPSPQGGDAARLWEAINDYAVACGGNPSENVYGNTRRQEAVAKIEAALRARLDSAEGKDKNGL